MYAAEVQNRKNLLSKGISIAGIRSAKESA